ncbi:15122_t:CDS:2, partial [Cetraspora pellucida]
IDVSSNADWHNAGLSFCSSLIHSYNKKPAVFVSKILEDKCVIELYQDASKIKTFYGSTPSNLLLKKQHINIPTCKPINWINLPLMTTLYKYHLKKRTLSNINWYHIFQEWIKQKDNIIELYTSLKSYQLWTKVTDPTKDRDTLAYLHAARFLNTIPTYTHNFTQTFWSCFNRALENNKKNYDRK